MADFVEISKDDRWAMKWGGVFIRDELDYDNQPSHYSHMENHMLAPELRALPAKPSIAPVSDSSYAKFDKGTFVPALIWPVHAAQTQAAAPFVAAGISALLLVPMFVPAINLTATLLSGYAAGGAVYYAQNVPATDDSRRDKGDVERYVETKNSGPSGMKLGVVMH